MTQQTKRPNLLPYLLALLVLVGIYGFMSKPAEPEPSYAEVRELFETEQVSAFTVTDTTLRMKLREPIDGKTELKKDLFSVTLFYDDLGELIEQQKAAEKVVGRLLSPPVLKEAVPNFAMRSPPPPAERRERKYQMAKMPSTAST